MNMLKTKILIAAAIAAGVSGAASAASANEAYATDTWGHISRDNYNECWRTPYWTPARAIPECDAVSAKAEPKPAAAPAPVIAKEIPAPAPEPAPAPVAAPAPAPVVEPVAVVAPAPVAAPEPAPQPREQWKTILTQKPVLIEGANFETRSAKLLKPSEAKLNEVVTAAKEHSEIKLEVSGHTDSRGKTAYNQKLSEQRAASVKEYLVTHGVAADRISTIGYGETKPIADNKTDEGRATNRRVEIRYVIEEKNKIRVTE
jgi:OmpA-OmpF porin, OOP family